MRKPVGGFAGIAVYVDTSMSPGTVEFRDADGKPVGWIFNVAEVSLGQTPVVVEQSAAPKQSSD